MKMVAAGDLRELLTTRLRVIFLSNLFSASVIDEEDKSQNTTHSFNLFTKLQKSC